MQVGVAIGVNRYLRFIGGVFMPSPTCSSAPTEPLAAAAVARLVSPDGRLAVAGMEVKAEAEVGAGSAPVVAKELSRARDARRCAPERSAPAPDEEPECDR